MTWLDRDIGTCQRCVTERRLFEAEGSGTLLCSVCTLEDAKKKQSAMLKGLADTEQNVLHIPVGVEVAGLTSRARRQAWGLCWECNDRATRGLRCGYHADLMSQNLRRLQEQRRANGVCIRCPNKSNGTAVCETCLDRDRARNRRRRRSA